MLAATGRVAEHVAQLRGEQQYLPIEPPRTLRTTLRPYQRRGYAWLHFITRSGFGACLADDMGLGKTVQTLALIAHDWAEEPTGPVLLVCPISVIGNWQREVARFTPSLPMHVHHGGDRERGNAFGKLVAKRAIVVPIYTDAAVARWNGWPTAPKSDTGRTSTSGRGRTVAAVNRPAPPSRITNAKRATARRRLLC